MHPGTLDQWTPWLLHFIMFVLSTCITMAAVTACQHASAAQASVMPTPARQHHGAYLEVKLFLLATPAGDEAAAANHGVPNEAMLGPGNPCRDTRLVQACRCNRSSSHMGESVLAPHMHQFQLSVFIQTGQVLGEVLFCQPPGPVGLEGSPATLQPQSVVNRKLHLHRCVQRWWAEHADCLSSWSLAGAQLGQCTSLCDMNSTTGAACPCTLAVPSLA